MHLAELNISKWKISPYSNGARGFIDKLDLVNNLAKRSDGFVWRLLDEERNESGATPIGDIKTILTLSVWETPQHLEQFVWNTVHKQIYNKKAEWFSHMESHHFVMWWIEEGHRPDLHEAKERLDYLDKQGDSDHAFGWSHLPHIKLWQQQSCA